VVPEGYLITQRHHFFELEVPCVLVHLRFHLIDQPDAVSSVLPYSGRGGDNLHNETTLTWNPPPGAGERCACAISRLSRMF